MSDNGGTDSSEGTYGPVGVESGGGSGSGTPGTAASQTNPFTGISSGQILFMGLDGRVMGSVNLTFDQLNNIFKTQVGQFKGPGPWADVKAWGAVGDGAADDTAAIQGAMDSLLSSGTVYFPVGTYKTSSSLEFSDRDLGATFETGGVIRPSGAFAVFEVPDGLTAVRKYLFQNPSVVMTGLSGQEFLRISDTGGYALVEVYTPNIEKPECLVNFAAYDITYTRGHRVRFEGGRCLPNGDASTLCKTSNPPDTFAGFVTVSFSGTLLSAGEGFDLSLMGLWTISIDGDLSLRGEQSALGIKAGSACGALDLIGYQFAIGDGDFRIEGAHGIAGTRISSGGMYGLTVNSRLFVWDSGGEITGYSNNLAFQLRATTSVSGLLLGDNLGLVNPGIEITATGGAMVSKCSFFTGFSAGCIKTAKPNCVIEGNVFSAFVTGKTILLVNPSDNCSVHDNIGTANGTGITLVGATTIANEHNNF